jgi:ABC-type transport system substrate-binding protein
MKKPIIAIIVLALVAGVAYLALRDTGKSSDDRPLVIGFENDVPTFDTLALGNVFALRVGSQVFEGLAILNEENRVVGGVAESWKSSPDFKTWTFKLRPGVKFHPHPALEGKDRTVIADDVIYSFTRMLSKDAVPAGPLASVLAGAKEFQAGTTKSVSGIKAVSPTEVEFTLIRPDALFPGRIASPAYGIVSKPVIEAAGTNFGQTVGVGTGPFKFVERRGNEIVLRRFAEHWANGKGVETVVFRTVKEDAVRLAEVKAGVISASYATAPMLDGLVEKSGDSLKIKSTDAGKLALLDYPVFNSYFLAFNHPKVDPDLRRAIALAVDRKEIIAASFPVSGISAAGPIPLACAGYQSKVGGDIRDLAAAKVALDAYKAKNPGVTPKIKLLTCEVAQSIPIGEVIQSQLKPLGIEVELVQQSFNAVIGAIQKGDFESLIIFFEYQYSTPQLILENFFTSPAVPLPNVFHYKNPENDTAIGSLFSIGDEKQSLEQAAVVEKNIVEEAPGAFLLQTKQVILLSPDLEGVRFNAANFPVLLNAAWK